VDVPPTLGLAVGAGDPDVSGVAVATEVAAGDAVGTAEAVWQLAEPLSVKEPPYAGT